MNSMDTVTWTWEGIEAWRVIVYSLSQFCINLSIEFMPPYKPSQEEMQDPKLFAANVRAVMADRAGVPTTDCNYFDYLRIEKSRSLVKRVQKLQKKMEITLLEATGEEKGLTVDMDLSGERLGVAQDLPELSVVSELCGNIGDLRNLRLVVMLATEEDALETFLAQTFTLYNPELGPDEGSCESLEGVLTTVVFLTQKEAKEALLTLTKGEDRQVEEKNRRMEKVAESGSSLLSAGKDVVSDVSATITASRDKVTDVLSSAVTSLHKRTDSKSEASDKKLD